jgi:hypothetical protein
MDAAEEENDTWYNYSEIKYNYTPHLTIGFAEPKVYRHRSLRLLQASV